MAKSVEWGGAMYLSAMRLPSVFTPGHQPLAGGLHRGRVPLLGGVHQAQVILLGKFAVNGQPHGVPILSRPGSFTANSTRSRLPGTMATFSPYCSGASIWPQQRAQLHFAPDAPGFHVGEHLFQVAHAHRQALHFAQAACIPAPSRALTWAKLSLRRLSRCCVNCSSTVRRMALSC